uniref:Uncharacterized protein n=1 Tax=Utricularia reniformis TaxID=192314 RepID=A0A1Y0B092_9LAMI|nr:hypothetical protein AEK19_MT0589 [Utricularia reniformis]ART30845.1 hypothetical protein AEK19_MT0589 [Utricularia reniformis]
MPSKCPRIPLTMQAGIEDGGRNNDSYQVPFRPSSRWAYFPFSLMT